MNVVDLAEGPYFGLSFWLLVNLCMCSSSAPPVPSSFSGLWRPSLNVMSASAHLFVIVAVPAFPTFGCLQISS